MTLPTVADTRRDTRQGRFYVIDGVQYPSTTTILQVIAKPALIGWAAKEERLACLEAARAVYADTLASRTDLPPSTFALAVDGRLGKERAHRRKLREAGEIGTQAHAYIEWWLRKQLDPTLKMPAHEVSEPALAAFLQFEQWATSVRLQPIYLEQVVYSKDPAVAGTLDCYARLMNDRARFAVIDFKTGKAVYPEARLQNLHYQYALSDMGLAVADTGYIVRLPKTLEDPAIEVVEVPWDVGEFRRFEAAVCLWEGGYGR